MQIPQGEESAVDQWAAEMMAEVPMGTNILDLPALALKLLKPKLEELGNRLKSDRQAGAGLHAVLCLRQSPGGTLDRCFALGQGHAVPWREPWTASWTAPWSSCACSQRKKTRAECTRPE